MQKIFNNNKEIKSESFCNFCKKPKKYKFCKHCNKETRANVTINAETLAIDATLNRATLSIQRGEEAFNYFIVAFNVLATFCIAIIAIGEIQSIYKIIYISFSVVGIYYICFVGVNTRNSIIGFFIRVKDRKDKGKL